MFQKSVKNYKFLSILKERTTKYNNWLNKYPIWIYTILNLLWMIKLIEIQGLEININM